MLLEFHYAERIDEEVLQFADGFLGEADQNVLARSQGMKRLTNESIIFRLDTETAEFQSRINTL